MSRDDPESWTDEQWPPTFKGIINVLAVAHQDFVWKARSHPKVLQVEVNARVLCMRLLLGVCVFSPSIPFYLLAFVH